MKKWGEKLTKILLVVFIAQLIFMIVANLLPAIAPSVNPVSPSWFSLTTAVIVVAILVMLTGFFVFREKIAGFFSKLSPGRKRLIFAVFLGLVCLAGFLLRFSLMVLSARDAHVLLWNDASAYFTNAQSLAKTGHYIGANYVGFYPYLSSFAAILAGAMKLLGEASFGVVFIVNLAFDFGGAVILYKFVERLTASRKYAAFAFALWILSPFEIAFATLSLPIVAVNFCVILSIYLLFLISRNHKNKLRSAALVFALGLALGFGNALRPMFIVFLAVVVAGIITFLFRRHGLSRRMFARASVTTILLIVPFFAIGALNSALAEKFTGYSNLSSQSGWSIFLGGNKASNGAYNFDDGSLVDEKVAKIGPMAAQKYFLSAGISRYESLSLLEFARLIGNKALIIFGNQNSSAYNSNHNYNGVATFGLGTFASQILISMSGIYILAILAFAIVFVWQKLRARKTEQWIIITVAMFIVAFFAMLAVEAMNRYAQPFYPILMLFAVLGAKVLTDKARVYFAGATNNK